MHLSSYDSTLRLAFGLLLVGVCSGADWLQFRGTQNAGYATDTNVPATWSKDENVAWKAPLPGKGVSGPIVVAGRVVVTSSSGPKQDRLHVQCYDAASGSLRWERQFWATGRTLCHPTSAVAAPTPASDGQRIFAFYSSNDLVCLDLDGNLQWLRGLSHDYPHAGNDVGMASSPLVVGGTVVVQIENQGDSFAAGLDAATGETLWKQPRKPFANWSSPVVLRGKTAETSAVLLQWNSGLTAYHPVTGKQLWEHNTGGSSIPSTTVDGETIYLPGGTLTALKRDKSSLASDVLWENNKLAPGNASPLVYRDRVYVLNKAGVLTCAKATDGEIVWQTRLKGPFWATPVIAGEHAYCVNQDGLAQVVKLGETKGEIVGESSFEEPVLGTPAIADGALYVRSQSNLWKISKR